MGIDIVNCNLVILYGILFLIINLVQEVGRIGGDGKEFIVLLLYNEYYLYYVYISKKYIYIIEICLRVFIMNEFFIIFYQIF